MTDETQIDEVTELRRRVNSIEDYSKEFLWNQIQSRDGRIDELEDRMDRLEEIVLEVQDSVDGVAWNTLLDLGHDDLSNKDSAKPLVYNAMERAVEGTDGFTMDTTHAECADGVKREVKAIRVNLEDLPASAAGKEFTTGEGPSPAAETIDSEANTTNLSD